MTKHKMSKAERAQWKRMRKQPSCRNCACFRVMDPDVFSIITKGACLHPDNTGRHPAAVDGCWRHKKETLLDKAKKTGHKIAGHFRAWKRSHGFYPKDKRPLPKPMTITANKIEIFSHGLWLEYPPRALGAATMERDAEIAAICEAFRNVGYDVTVAQWHKDEGSTYDITLDTIEIERAQRCLRALCGYKV